MDQTLNIYKYINLVCVALGLLFWSTDTYSFHFLLVIGTTGTMLLLIIANKNPYRYIWTILAYLTFFGGMGSFMDSNPLYLLGNGFLFFGCLFVLGIMILILSPPATFLHGVLYSFWILIIPVGINILIEAELGVSFRSFYVVSPVIVSKIFENWSWLLFLSGYITSVLPLYIGKVRSSSPRFHFLSGIFIYLYTIPVQVLSGIGLGVYQSIRNYISVFKQQVHRQTSTEAELNDQPAIENYWFKKAFTDWKTVFQTTIPEQKWTQNRLTDQAKTMTYTYGLTLGAIPFTVLIIASITSIIIGFFLLVLASTIHLIVIGIVAIPVYIYYLVFRGYDSYKLRRNRVATVCPSCYHRSTLPNYICYHCEREHSDLRPGRYGIRKRTCLCGTKLPTSAFDQRHELHAICKNEECKASLWTKEATPFCFSIIGGPSSGKTSFVLSALRELEEKIAPERSWTMDFLQSNEEEYYHKQSNALKLGKYPHKTAEKKPFAYNVKLTNSNWKNSKLLYLYDPAGEVYRSSGELRSHAYLDYVDGYILMIDPFSLPELAADYEANNHPNWSSINPSDTLPEDAYNMLMVHLAKRYQMKEEQQLSIPIAIVINKVDAFNIEDQLTATVQSNETNNQSEEELLNRQCKAFLKDFGYRNFVKRIESKFKNVQYFTSSSSPNNQSDIYSSRVITWLMEQKK